MKNLIILSFTALILTFTGCSDGNIHKITVASELANCTGVAPQQCLLIKVDGATEWSLWYSSIEGFDYQEGFEYELEVRKETIENPPADAPSMKYVLVKVVSQAAKQSEGLPSSVNRE